MVSDWLRVIDAVGDLAEVDGTNIGYFGLSMGTRFGVPTCAAIGGRFRCAVLGTFGLQEMSGLRGGLDVSRRIMDDAQRITCPILFHVQWNDEVFPRERPFELFNSFSSHDRQLIAYPGGHGETNAMAPRVWTSFLLEHLLSGVTPLPQSKAA